MTNLEAGSGDLEVVNGEAAFFTARQDAWHKLGTVTSAALDAADALRIAKLDYLVEKHPLTATIYDDDGANLVDVPGKYAAVRKSPWSGQYEALGVVGEQYTFVQNYQTVEFLDAFAQTSGAVHETAGSLDGGRKMFVSMKAPKGMLIGGHDAVDLYLVALNSHDGSTAFGINATPIRPVCRNTVLAGLRHSKGTWKGRHTTGIMARVEEAQQAVKVMWDYMSEFEATANTMLDTAVSRYDLTGIVDTLWDTRNVDDLSKRGRTLRDDRVETISQLFTTADTQDGIRGSAWGAFNAIVEYLDWDLPVRGSGDPDVLRAERVAAGGNLTNLKDRALALLS